LLLASACWAQVPVGAIEGIVIDPSRAPVPDARVTVTESATGRVLLLITNELGRYSVRNLPPGQYALRAAAPLFATTEVTSISVSAGAVVTQDVLLTLGQLEQVVSVTASPVAVDSTRQNVDTIISAGEIRNTPLFSRNFLDLAALAPGVIVRDGQSIFPSKTTGYRAVGISGRSGIGTRVQIDGIDVTDAIGGSSVSNVSSDAVFEFQLSRSSLDISSPMTSSGTVSIISKSGSNELHGTGFWDYYNQDMGARLNYLATAPPFRRNRAGVTAGGPFVGNKLFWFANWERAYQQEQSINATPEFPQVNVTHAAPTGIRYAKGRLDWNVSPSIRLFYSFQHDWNLATGGTPVSPIQSVNWSNVHTAALDLTRQRSTHSFRFGYVNYDSRVESRDPAVPFPLTPQGFPYDLSVGRFQAGPMPPMAQVQTYDQGSYNGSFFHGRHSLRFGGGVNRVAIGGYAAFSSQLMVSGVFSTATIAQVAERGGNVEDPLEYPLNSFNTGPSTGYFNLKAGQGYPHGAHYDTRTSWYAGDTFKATRRFTLNLGVRWEYDSGYFPNDRRVKRDPALDTWIPGASQFPVMRKDLFSPSFGFAYDPSGSGKTVIRGGFYLGYEPNVANNQTGDESAMLPPGLGPDSFSSNFVAGPDGIPINVDGKHPNGIYSDLQGRRIGDVIGLIGQVHQALQSAYAKYPFDPNKGPSVFSLFKGTTGIFFPGDQFKIPYSVQMNLGFQRQLRPGTVLSVDYVRNHGIGLPFTQVDFERRRDASTFNAGAARSQIASVLAGKTVDEWIAANPGKTIGSFGLINDSIWQGVTPDFLRAAFITGGFTQYRAVQVSLRGSRPSLAIFRDLTYLIGYALSRSESSSEARNAETITGQAIRDNRHPNARDYFGPTNLDHTHILSVVSTLRTAGGFHVSSLWSFQTPRSQLVSIPALNLAISGDQSFFGTNLKGDGGSSGSSYETLVPGINAGQLGRSVKTFADLNRVIQAFNQNYAGTLTPYGQALVNAGLFTAAQLHALGAEVPTIPLAPLNNPNPWHNLLTTDLRLDRPIRFRERVQVSPYVDFINLFNHAPPDVYPLGSAGLLAARFGSLNFDYANAPAGRKASDLDSQRSRLNPTRKVQIGVRVDF